MRIFILNSTNIRNSIFFFYSPKTLYPTIKCIKICQSWPIICTFCLHLFITFYITCSKGLWMSVDSSTHFSPFHSVSFSLSLGVKVAAWVTRMWRKSTLSRFSCEEHYSWKYSLPLSVPYTHTLLPWEENERKLPRRAQPPPYTYCPPFPAAPTQLVAFSPSGAQKRRGYAVQTAEMWARDIELVFVFNTDKDV